MTEPGQWISLDEILDLALEFKASDIHFKANMPPVFRIDGLIRSVPDLPVFDAEALRTMIMGILTPRQQQIFEETYELDCALLFADKARVRLNLYLDMESIGCAMRIVPLECPTIAELGLPPIVEELTHHRSGLILVTGITGAGKSTTLAAMVDAINERDPAHIYTMEDPVEFVHRPKRSIITQREVGFSTKSFGNALRGALRADPNVLLVGEMRDAFTIQMALRAAETGHLVLSTLHTPISAEDHPTHSGRLQPGGANGAENTACLLLEGGNSPTARAAGRGWADAVNEIMVVTPTVQEAILRGEIDELMEFIKNGQYDGMQTMDGALYNAYREGLVDADTARQYALNPAEMDRVLRGAVSR